LPGSGRSTFCYTIPKGLSVDSGQAVWVPFGSRILQGVVIRLTGYPSVEQTKEIVGVITSEPLLSLERLELACWIRDYYLCSLFEAVALMLPPGFERQLITFFRVSSPADEEALSRLSPEQSHLFRFIQERGKVSLKELEKKFGRKVGQRLTEQLVRRRLINKVQELERVKVKPKFASFLELKNTPPEAVAEATCLKQKRAYKQAAGLEFLAKQPHPILATTVKKSLSLSETTLRALEKRKLISVIRAEVKRDPLSHFHFKPIEAPPLTSVQDKVWHCLHSGLLEDGPKVFLLFGVTGSGKTEIYLRALAEIVAQGKRGICLVPEIALTSQTIERFGARFPGRVGVFHSGLSLGEQFDEWHRIRDGACDVVIGPRSALFTPQPNLGLIIIDEEHELSYKQQDKSPYYHARDVAIKLSQLTGAKIILGSATPDVETFYQAQRGEYQLLELPERITPRGPSPLPEVEIVDLKKELKTGNRGLLSRSLVTAMTETLSRGEQIILFLNRRGTATFVQCWGCGFVLRCRRCSVGLTYHSGGKKLICHRCGYAILVPQACPHCLNRRLKFLGIGTERVEEEVRRLFSEERLLRWDRDVVGRRRAHEELLNSFRSGKANVLIGTQMIAKGLDLPQVTLAGVINADTGLNLPDFRAGERTFQLLCQVAGRAGRGVSAGKVIVQTYSPEHYAIRAASCQDYMSFYNQETDYRRQFGYPPFSRLVRLTYSHTNPSLCQREAERMGEFLRLERDRKGIAGLSFIGPAPAFITRLRGRFWWQIILRGDAPAKFIADIPLPHGWLLDVDPMGLV